MDGEMHRTNRTSRRGSMNSISSISRLNRLRAVICILMMVVMAACMAGCAGSGDQGSGEDAGSGTAQEQDAESTDDSSDAGQGQPAVQIDRESAVVSYLGPQGTYTEEACGIFFEGKGEYIPYETVNDAVRALVDGDSNYAVIPQENTIGGAVIDYLDTLIDNTGVAVVGEVELPIDQNLLVLPGAGLSDIRTVYSHKQGIAQGREWLEQNLPDAEVIEVSSTAEGAKKVSESGDKSIAAIAGASAADFYGLEILADSIQNNDKNKTRFYVLYCGEPGNAAGAGSGKGSGESSEEATERLAFVVKGAAEDLPGLMDEMEELEMTLIAIHDRPQKTELGEYYYLIECEACSYENYQKLAEDSPFEFRYLGTFEAR